MIAMLVIGALAVALTAWTLVRRRHRGAPLNAHDHGEAIRRARGSAEGRGGVSDGGGG